VKLDHIDVHMTETKKKKANTQRTELHLILLSGFLERFRCKQRFVTQACLQYKGTRSRLEEFLKLTLPHVT
jgi:hypothetical protein